MVDIHRVGRNMIGNDREGIGHVLIGHAYSHLNLGQMPNCASGKIHWLQDLKCFCMCVHRYHMQEGDMGIPLFTLQSPK